MTKVITTASFRGGTGKSTIICNLSSYLSSLGMKVILIDADIISPGVHAIFGLDHSNFSKTLTDYLEGNADINDIVYDISSNINLAEETLFLVPSSISQGDIANLLLNKHSVKLSKVISNLSKKYNPDFIFVDTHPGINEDMLVISGSTDILFNVVRPDNQDYQGLEVSSNISKKLGVTSFVILNKVHPKMNRNKLISNVKSAFKIPVAGALPFSDDLMLSQSQYVFSDEHPDHALSNEIRNIADRVFNIRPKKHLEIMHEILEVTSKGISPEKFDSKQRSSNKYQKYTNDLIKRGFINIVTPNGKKLLKTSSKGQKYLKKYKIIRKFVDNFRL
ncbi:AAA family ATPase [Nanoarchaeota archaeon]